MKWRLNTWWEIFIGLIIFQIIFFACSPDVVLNKSDKLFTNISSSITKIDFQNKLVETESANYYKYMYSYIGGGVAAADFNNDGLEDLFFISNSHDNKLYINQGDLVFEDISVEAGIIKRKGFDAGVTVVDINNDGFLDIYITRGGWDDSNNGFANMLYVNEGLATNGVDISFKEQANEYGLDDNNRSIQASFFDYDKDGDLDVYISNTPDFEDKAAEVVDLIAARSDPRTLALKGSDKLYKNDGNGYFNDVSVDAGIHPDIGFGLNPQVGDLNNDGWLDIYVCNDFRIPDFAYINNGNGTFREGRNELFMHMSFNSMGGDIADINNDGLLDLLTLDMNPSDYIRSKTTMAMTSLSLFETMVQKDYHYQYMHNMLHLNNGNGSYSEIGNLAGIANTDWSWASLMADFDLDGYNDIFITNGVFRDVIDRDKNNEILQELRANGRRPTDADFLRFAQMLPQQKLSNFFYKNNGDLTFEDMSSRWVDSIAGFSNGAIYSDLDNDGDLDLVVNNINDKASIIKNNAIEKNLGNYLKVKCLGSSDNINGIGTTIRLSNSKGDIQLRQLINTRGFLSAGSNSIQFGLAKVDSIVSLDIIWPDGRTQRLQNISVNQNLLVEYIDASDASSQQTEDEGYVFIKQALDLKHIDPVYNDFEQQILLPHKLSQTGPAAASADVNGDGLADVYIGGARGHLGQLFISKPDGKFNIKSSSAFERDKQREDVGACFFDADGDGDKDLYVVSGSYEVRPNSKLLVDRFYQNDGKGNFVRLNGIIPELPIAGSVVVPADFDNDGDVDLFVGGRVIASTYPFPPDSRLLINDGGKFFDQTNDIAPSLTKIGMVTDASWSDIDDNGTLDLVVTGEWMGIEVLLNDDGVLTKTDKYTGLSESIGWWNKCLVVDIDDDGDKDIVAGNLGLNSKFHATNDKPFHIYTSDFDYNGTADVILAKYYKDMEVPVRGKTCTAQQIPHLASKIPSYTDFASRDIEGILGPGIKDALHYEATEFRSGIFENENGNFVFDAFENHVQKSPINSILYEDFDNDGIADLLLAGNNYMPEIETTRYDAGVGCFLKGFGNGDFSIFPNLRSGFFAPKDVRHLLKVNNQILVVNNDDYHDLYKLKAE